MRLMKPQTVSIRLHMMHEDKVQVAAMDGQSIGEVQIASGNLHHSTSAIATLEISSLPMSLLRGTYKTLTDHEQGYLDETQLSFDKVAVGPVVNMSIVETDPTVTLQLPSQLTSETPGRICLAKLSDKEWKCLGEDHVSSTGVVQAVLSQNGIYTAMFNPHVPPPLPEAPAPPSFWEQYQAYIIAASVGFLVLCLIVAYFISRLIRYRNKYRDAKPTLLKAKHEQKRKDSTITEEGELEMQVTINPLLFAQRQHIQSRLADVEAKLEQMQGGGETEELNRQRAALEMELQKIRNEAQASENKKKQEIKTPLRGSALGSAFFRSPSLKPGGGAYKAQKEYSQQLPAAQE